MTDDRDLRERFASLREEDRRHIPGYEHVLRNPRHDSPLRIGAVAAGLLVTAVAAFLLLSTRHLNAPSEGAAIQSIASWRAPTDFLLDTPGRDLLRKIPNIGVPSAAPSPGTRRRPIHSFNRERYT